MLSPKKRLLNVLRKEKVDRPPVICTGGMMNAAIVDIMNLTGYKLPEAHIDTELMVKLAEAIQQQTGFENLGIPFCMTVEAELLGSNVNYGSLSCEPKVVKELYSSVSEVQCTNRILSSKRMNTVTDAAKILSIKHPELPIIGNLTGPISLAASLVDPAMFLKELRKDAQGAHRVLDYVSNKLIEFASVLIEQGVTLISIGDPTATGEILGPKCFSEFAIPYLNKIIHAIHLQGVPVIVHICGNLSSVWNLIPLIHSDAISTDALVNLGLLKKNFPGITTMGNVSTYLLESGPAEKIVDAVQRLLAEGVDIISPACGLSTSTMLYNIRIMTSAVREL